MIGGYSVFIACCSSEASAGADTEEKKMPVSSLQRELLSLLQPGANCSPINQL